MAFLARLAKAKKGIELGVFTGYSALCFAEALPEDGKLIAIDVDKVYTDVAEKYWKEAGVDHKIQLRLEGGSKVLDELISESSNHNSFDFAYVDADKPNYLTYFEKLERLIRPGGFIMFDNILWQGFVADEKKREEDEITKTMYQVVQKALNDSRF